MTPNTGTFYAVKGSIQKTFSLAFFAKITLFLLEGKYFAVPFFGPKMYLPKSIEGNEFES